MIKRERKHPARPDVKGAFFAFAVVVVVLFLMYYFGDPGAVYE